MKQAIKDYAKLIFSFMLAFLIVSFFCKAYFNMTPEQQKQTEMILLIGE